MLKPGEFTKEDLAVGDVVLIAVKNYLVGGIFHYSSTKKYDSSQHFLFKLSIANLDSRIAFTAEKSMHTAYDSYASKDYNEIEKQFYDYIFNRDPPEVGYSLIYSKFEDHAAMKIEKHGYDGMNCKHCNLFCEYVSEPNMPDNSFLCYGCRTNPTTMFILGFDKR